MFGNFNHYVWDENLKSCLSYILTLKKSKNQKLCSSCCWQDDIELISFVPGFVFIIYLVWNLNLLRVILQISNVISFGYLSPLFSFSQHKRPFSVGHRASGCWTSVGLPVWQHSASFSFPVYVLFWLLVAPPASIPYPVQMTGQWAHLLSLAHTGWL